MNIVFATGLLATGFVSGAIGMLMLCGRLLQPDEFDDVEEAGSWRHDVVDFV